ncbi:hypothetical protein HPB47_013732 [Ixodes persulcatus]|uniref:Uncharacterized protein n=1 Tax=Ixodes persulcatus TaxID=34615 RepID=A0AC60R0J5_IXOPE|nr:hypothetical protein HPB47_013732 [Ixodes persulcatus]
MPSGCGAGNPAGSTGPPPYASHGLAALNVKRASAPYVDFESTRGRRSMEPRTVHSVCPPKKKGGPAVPYRSLPMPTGHLLPVLPGPCRSHWPPLVTVGRQPLVPAGHQLPVPAGHQLPVPAGHHLPVPAGHHLPAPVGHHLPIPARHLPCPYRSHRPPLAATCHHLPAPAGPYRPFRSLPLMACRHPDAPVLQSLPDPLLDPVGGCQTPSESSDRHLPELPPAPADRADSTAPGAGPGIGGRRAALESPESPPERGLRIPPPPLDPSTERNKAALRSLIARAPPVDFEGPWLWDVARQATMGVNVVLLLDQYLKQVFTVAQPRVRRRKAPPCRRNESRRKRKRREYAETQNREQDRQHSAPALQPLLGLPRIRGPTGVDSGHTPDPPVMSGVGPSHRKATMPLSPSTRESGTEVESDLDVQYQSLDREEEELMDYEGPKGKKRTKSKKKAPKISTSEEEDARASPEPSSKKSKQTADGKGQTSSKASNNQKESNTATPNPIPQEATMRELMGKAQTIFIRTMAAVGGLMEEPARVHLVDSFQTLTNIAVQLIEENSYLRGRLAERPTEGPRSYLAVASATSSSGVSSGGTGGAAGQTRVDVPRSPAPIQKPALLIYPTHPKPNSEYSQVVEALRAEVSPEDLGLSEFETRRIKGGALISSTSASAEEASLRGVDCLSDGGEPPRSLLPAVYSLRAHCRTVPGAPPMHALRR